MKQTERVLDYIKRFGSITQLEALADLGIMRLGARVWDLRHEGYPIKSKLISRKNRFGETTYFSQYSLEVNNA